MSAPPPSPAPSDPSRSPAKLDLTVPGALAGARVDRVVALLSGMARSAVAELVDAGGIRLDGHTVTTRSRTVQSGQRLEVDVKHPVVDVPVPDSSVVFGVVHEDAELVVIDKPAGLVVHHGAGNHEGTLVDGLLARFPDLAGLAEAGGGDPDRPGIVHRLDKGTSGLLVVARTPEAYRSLAKQFRAHSAGREYLVLAAGTVEGDEGTVDAPIGRSTRQRTRMAVTARGQAGSHRVPGHRALLHAGALHLARGPSRHGSDASGPGAPRRHRPSRDRRRTLWTVRGPSSSRHGDAGTGPDVPARLPAVARPPLRGPRHMGGAPPRRPGPRPGELGALRRPGSEDSGGLVSGFDLGQRGQLLKRTRLGLAGPAHTDAQS